MKKHYFYIVPLLILGVGTFALREVNDGSRPKVVKLEAQALIGATTIETDWIYIGTAKYFNLGFVARTDCTNFTEAFNDSFGFDIDYELALDPSTAASSTNIGFYPYSLGTLVEVMSFAITDTTEKYRSLNHIRQYQSLHTLATPISPSLRVKFHIDFDAIHATIATKSILYDWYFYIQP